MSQSKSKSEQHEKGNHDKSFRKVPDFAPNVVAATNDEEFETEPPAIELPRLIRRNLAFSQSRNHIQIQHNQGLNIVKLTYLDLFHVILQNSTFTIMLMLVIIWTLVILLFAWIYLAIDSRDGRSYCGLGNNGEHITFYAAFAFSLETCTTVGYGLPSGVNSFFEQCPNLQFAIYVQMLWSMLFNATLLAFCYSRLSNSENRGAQVVFSSKALVSLDERTGQPRFQVRIYDVSARNPVVEAHVRLYAIAKRRPVPRPLRVLQPNDDLGAVLFLSLPSVVVHHVDDHSLLCNNNTTAMTKSSNMPYSYPPRNASQGLILRQADSATGGREDVVCPVCGDSYGSFERWAKHAKYQRMVEKDAGYPVECSHLSISEEDLKAPPKEHPDLLMERLQYHFQEEISEVLCIVEGIDPLLSGTFQALQSYRFEDVVFSPDARFQPCLSVSRNKNLVVDLDVFHDIDYSSESGSRRARGPESLRPHDSLINKD